MDKNDPELKQTAPEKLAGAPEISGGSRAVPQLIRSTKSTKVEPSESDAPVIDPDSDIASEVEETPSPQNPVEPAETEPVAERRMPAPTAWRREPTEEELATLDEYWNEPGDPDGVFAAEQHEKWREEHPAPASTPRATYKKGHPFRTTFIILVLIAAGAAGAWWFGDHQAAKSNPPAVPQKQPAAKPPTSAVTPTTQYLSSNFNIGLNYPQTWKLTDTATKLTLASPTLQLQTPTGKTSGHVVLTVQKQQTAIPGFPADGAVAALESQKLTYTQPTPIQRAQTYLSFLSYGQSSGLDALYVTGDNGYMQGQLVPLSDVVQADPLISVGFATCESNDCATGTPTPLTLLAGSWKTASFNSQVIRLLQSVTLQD